MPTKNVNGQVVEMTEEEFQAFEAMRSLSPSQKKEKALERLAAYRYEKEVGGITFNGFPMYTDRDTQAKLESAKNRAVSDSEFTVKWKGMNGTFIELDAATIIAIANAVFDHVQACYQREAELQIAIESNPETDITTGWPV